MTIELINVGTVPNDQTGDPIRTAFQKINTNFGQFAPVAFSGQYSSLLGTPSLAKVALTGQYTDLLNSPTFGLLAFLNTINNQNWFGMPLQIGNGGTGQTTAAAAFNALSPMVDIGDLIYGKQLGQAYRLPIGAHGQVLTVSSDSQPLWTTLAEIPAFPDIPPAPDEADLVHYGVAAGTNVLTSAVTPELTFYENGIFVQLLITHTNTGNVAFSANGIGVIPVVCPDGTNIPSGTFKPGQVVLLTMVSGTWQWVNYFIPPSLPEIPIPSGLLTNVIIITGSGYYTPSVGAHQALVFATGGGGSGGGGGYCTPDQPVLGGNYRAYGGQGGESGTTVISYTAVSHSSPISCTIGAGGVPINNGPYTSSGSGGTTRFGTYAVAPGGIGGTSVTGSEVNAPHGSSSGASYNIMNLGSNPGSCPFGIWNTANSVFSSDGTSSGTAGYMNVGGGNGGSSFWGGAGTGSNPALNVLTNPPQYSGPIGGFNATGLGSGGGGCSWSAYYYSPTFGGYGGNGVIMILEFS